MRNTTAPIVFVVQDIRNERERQEAKFPDQHLPDGTHERFRWQAIRYRDATDEAAGTGGLTWRHILLEEVFEALTETDPGKLREELIQSAAVIVRWVEDIDSREAPHGS